LDTRKETTKFIVKTVLSIVSAALILASCGAPGGSPYGSRSNLNGTDDPPLNRGEQRRISAVVADTRNAFAAISPTIPQDLLRSAKCIAVLRTVQAGFIFGGTGGDGMATCRTADGTWSAPSFLAQGGASVGLQIGGGVVETVLLFMTDTSRQVLERTEFTLGAGVGAMVGPISGGSGSAVSPSAQILTWSRGVGLQARIVIDGVVISHAEARNSKVYQSLGVSGAAQIMRTPAALTPMIATPFVDAVMRIAM
jgi:lipid-binding SYLF domain-containing protein